MKLFLIRLGEISLKGMNRSLFEKRLKNNIKLKLHPYGSTVLREKGRFYLSVDDSCPDSTVEFALSTSFGVVGFSKAVYCEKSFEAIKEAARNIISCKPFSEGKGTFKVCCKRADKQFAMTSFEIECELGGLVLDTYPQMKVDVHNPQYKLNVEIRDKTYLYISPVQGPDGLPVGTAGKGLLLLSGGIDSPVAMYKMCSRGLKMDCLYFHAYPYTSNEALAKVQKLAQILAPFNIGTNLYVADFTEAELWIKDHSKEAEHTLMMRACMMKVANKIAKEENVQAKVIVTGEALSQVASQTLDSLCFTSSMSELPVLRPLVGSSKAEIIDIAKKIGTYETSILPFDDCCVIFSPKHPLVKPEIQAQTKSFENMNIDEILEKCVSETKLFSFNQSGFPVDL